jgi:hypothetical protein
MRKVTDCKHSSDAQRAIAADRANVRDAKHCKLCLADVRAEFSEYWNRGIKINNDYHLSVVEANARSIVDSVTRRVALAAFARARDEYLSK